MGNMKLFNRETEKISKIFPHLQIGTHEEPFELLVKPLQHSLTVRIFGIIWKRNWKIKHNTSPEYKTNNLGYFARNKVEEVLPPLCPLTNIETNRCCRQKIKTKRDIYLCFENSLHLDFVSRAFWRD